MSFLTTYRKPEYLNRPVSADDDPSQAYTPPPIIQSASDGDVAPLEEDQAPHFSNLQPRTETGQFDGAPVYPDEPQEPKLRKVMTEKSERVSPATVDDIWSLGAPDTQGVDPAVASNLRVAAEAAKDPPSSFLTSAAKKQSTTSDGAGASSLTPETHPSLIKTTAPPMPNYNARQSAPDAGPGGGGQPATAAAMADGPPPNLTDKRGRPIPNASIADPLERSMEYKDRLSNYVPQKEHGWRRYVAPILQGWAAGQKDNRSPWAGLGGAIAGGIRGQVQPTLTDEQWKTSQLKDTQDQIDQHLEQQKTQVGIAAQQSMIKNRTDLEQLRQKRDERQQAHVKDVQNNTAINQILSEYGKVQEYDPSDAVELSNPNSLTGRAAKLGMTLRPKSRAQRGGFTFNGMRWEPDRSGKFQPLKDDAGNIIEDATAQDRLDEVRRHNQVTEGQGAERVKQGWAHVDISKQNAGAVGQFKTRFNQARTAVNRFNELTRQAASQDNYSDPTGVKARAIIQQRDQLEGQIRDQYGDIVMNDDKNKPSQLRKQWSVSQFKTTNPKANMKTAQAQAESEGAIIVP